MEGSSSEITSRGRLGILHSRFSSWAVGKGLLGDVFNIHAFAVVDAERPRHTKPGPLVMFVALCDLPKTLDDGFYLGLEA